MGLAICLATNYTLASVWEIIYIMGLNDPLLLMFITNWKAEKNYCLIHMKKLCVYFQSVTEKEGLYKFSVLHSKVYAKLICYFLMF